LAGRGTAWRGPARRGGSVLVWLGTASPGLAVMAWRVEVRLGVAVVVVEVRLGGRGGRGSARRGRVRFGGQVGVRHGVACPGKAVTVWQGWAWPGQVWRSRCGLSGFGKPRHGGQGEVRHGGAG
jgi:hypothetical protein